MLLLLPLPPIVESLLLRFSGCFTEPSFHRFIELCLGAILTPGRHTVTRMLASLRHLVRGDASCYHRFFSRARWSLWQVGKVLALLVLAAIPAHLPVIISLDDTGYQHRGPNVYGKGRHRDAVRSTRSHTVWLWGHRWVVLAVCVKFPFRCRPVALPILMALYKPESLNDAEDHRHKTPTYLGQQLLRALIRWFPDRRFVILADGGFRSHDLSGFCQCHAKQLTLVSRFYPDAALYEPPPVCRHRRRGRPRVRGDRLLSPQQVVASRKRLRHLTVIWYGGKSRRIRYVSGTGQWYRSGHGLVAVRWVFVQDLEGEHEDQYFYSTDTSLTAQQIIEHYVSRWPIETTFQEAREHLGVHTTRQWTRLSVLRMTPLLLGLYSLVWLIYSQQVRQRPTRPSQWAWYEKDEPTFADAVASVRRALWQQTIFATAAQRRAFQKIPRSLQNLLLDCLCRAA